MTDRDTSDDIDETTGASAEDAELSEVERLRAERDQLDDKLKRSMADLANFRKRQVRDLDDARKRAVEGLTAELLPVLDNFHLALAAHEQHGSPGATDDVSMIEGLKMVRSLLEGTLERHGLAEIPAAGTTFDPNLHEAVGIDTASDAEAGTVTRVLQRGYRFGERVLRASRVMVSGDAEEQTDESGSE